MTKRIKEADIVKHLLKRTREHLGIARKVSYEGRNGAPDWWLFFPLGLLIIVETKRPTGSLRAVQTQELLALEGMGQNTEVAYTYQDVDALFDKYFPDKEFTLCDKRI